MQDGDGVLPIPETVRGFADRSKSGAAQVALYARLFGRRTNGLWPNMWVGDVYA